MRTLVLGGARSGKSRYAEQSARTKMNSHTVHYVATATRRDAEMQTRIVQHQQRRPRQWHTHEVPLALPATLTLLAQPQHVILVDCLTLWLSNCLAQEPSNSLQASCFTPSPALLAQNQALVNSLAQLPAECEVILVSNEIGQGVIPMGSATRWFVDQMGWLNQQVAEVCDQVIWMVAGLPHVLKAPA